VVQADLVRVLEDWFDKCGKVPDNREIQRFIAEAYKQRPGKP
jgi:hypothetical protein